MTVIMFFIAFWTATPVDLDPPQEAGCPPGTVEVRREQRGRNTHVFCKKIPTTLSEIDSELSAVNKRIERTRTELERFSDQVRGYRAALDEWTHLPLDAREKARLAAKDTVATVLLVRLQTKAAEVLARDAKLKLSSNRFWERLDGARFPEIVRAQKEFWDRIHVAKTDREIAAALMIFKDTLGVLTVLEGKDREEALTFVLRSISLLNDLTFSNPGVSLLISGGELLVADAYAYVGGALARKRVEQLLTLSEHRLLGLKALTDQYKADIDWRKALQTQRGKLRAR